MPPAMHDSADRETILARARRLSPATRPRWGRMNASQMIVHITDSMRMATGVHVVRGRRHPAGLPVIKQLLLYVVPMAKNLPTARELVARAPGAFDDEMRAFFASVQRFAERDAATAWPDHPLFGAMSPHAWGALAYKHTDHHLTQFGL